MYTHSTFCTYNTCKQCTSLQESTQRSPGDIIFQFVFLYFCFLYILIMISRIVIVYNCFMVLNSSALLENRVEGMVKSVNSKCNPVFFKLKIFTTHWNINILLFCHHCYSHIKKKSILLMCKLICCWVNLIATEIIKTYSLFLYIFKYTFIIKHLTIYM